ncbi:class I SAM-dependent methyltransferase [Microbacterium sp. A82]|uniref:class I SAM-dependent methyltransferase n=1 Tax=Microbacterium sp. A82 TaxID=3450452 RepID=UPI003F2CF532
MSVSDGPKQSEIDARIQAYYGGIFDENARLSTRSAQGPLEFQRTQALIAATVHPDARILDIGGGAGAHAVALQAAGHAVTLVDPVPQHVTAAQTAGVTASIADARELPFPDESFDATLMLGPLYHLADAADRALALQEAMRVTRPGGSVFAGAISRYIAFGQVFLTRERESGDSDEWIALLQDGRPSPRMRFPAGHFHTAEGLAQEIATAGFVDVTVHGVEGPAGMLLEQLSADTDPETRAAAAHLASVASAMPGIRDFSGHLLAVGRVHG